MTNSPLTAGTIRTARINLRFGSFTESNGTPAIKASVTQVNTPVPAGLRASDRHTR